jgi:hypothetical protein
MDESKHQAVKRRDFIKQSAQATGLLVGAGRISKSAVGRFVKSMV